VIRASDLIGCVVHSESGDRIGRVHDLRAHRIEGEWRLVGLLVGPRGIVARLFGGTEEEPVRAGRVIPWEAITKLEYGSVTVRDVIADAPTEP
jgi:sporulation protein YlmC with PRC-barrel domain